LLPLPFLPPPAHSGFSAKLVEQARAAAISSARPRPVMRGLVVIVVFLIVVSGVFA
jgi:hypothetical protein